MLSTIYIEAGGGFPSSLQSSIERFDLSLVNSLDQIDGFVLIYSDDKLQLACSDDAFNKRLVVDFFSGKLGFRLAHANTKNELIAKAVGIKPGFRPTVVDATAGLGRDGVLLACLGCEVTLVEQNPMIAALLADGLRRLSEKRSDLNIKLMYQDSRQYLSDIDMADYPDVIYLDPMFPERRSHAKVKQDLQWLQRIVTNNQDPLSLLTCSRSIAKRRVVLKRPRISPLLVKPDVQYMGSSSRFDVFLSK